MPIPHCHRRRPVRLSEIRLALIPNYGATQVLPLLIGETRALDLMLSGDSIHGETALRWGLVDRIVTPEQPLDAAVESRVDAPGTHRLPSARFMRRSG